ncbi:hypothetical protein BpHYR1_033020 [Brachionus plicatilis]|uniref:Uncharacterized protein n=1 Tax=Brachionus plicatilis TaxID=10195 RepID=A0A3M7QTQ2_BRAPC|nr:hypothetical protein BpHYR1_033020 [Brachionus plicatilis]
MIIFSDYSQLPDNYYLKLYSTDLFLWFYQNLREFTKILMIYTGDLIKVFYEKLIAENDFQNLVEQICDVPSVSNKILEQNKFDMFLNYEFDLDREQKLKTIVSEYDVLNIDLFLYGIIGLLDDQLNSIIIQIDDFDIFFSTFLPFDKKIILYFER